MISNEPIQYKYKELPIGTATIIYSSVGSSSSTTISYNHPKYTGTIIWIYNKFYGELASQFDYNGQRLQACNGHKIHEVLHIHEDYCIRIGCEGWDKYLTRQYFEMWLQTT